MFGDLVEIVRCPAFTESSQYLSKKLLLCNRWFWRLAVFTCLIRKNYGFNI